jgi:DNA repair exonuclease SbcCD ATPase subunit
MSDATVSLANVKLLINGNLPSNMLSYVAKQAISGDQVMYCMAIRNSILLQWYNAKSKQKKYVDFLNEIIPDGSVKIKSMSLRVEVRLRRQCCNVNNKVKRLNSKGWKEKRVVYLNEMSKVSILVSNVATAVEMEQEIKSKGKEIEMLHKRLENLNVELEEWKKQYQNLEKEKERLFFEMKSEKETQISNLVLLLISFICMT